MSEDIIRKKTNELKNCAIKQLIVQGMLCYSKQPRGTKIYLDLYIYMFSDRTKFAIKSKNYYFLLPFISQDQT